MSITSFFNRLAEKRVAKEKYKQLAAAIKAGDLEAVRAALKDGADPSYHAGEKKKDPLALALQQKDPAILEALLKTEQGMSAVAIFSYDFRTIKKTGSEQIFFAPSYLYAALEMGREDLAVVLAKNFFVDVEKSGDILAPGGPVFRNDSEYAVLVKTPLALAQSKNMPLAAQAIEDRLKPLLALRAENEAKGLTDQADKKRLEAEALLREAEALKAKAATLRSPAGLKP